MITHDGLDPLAILHSLGFAAVQSAAPCSGGSDTAIWRVEYDHTVYALRVFRPEQNKASKREIAVMQLASSNGLPVPRIHAAGTWQNRCVLLLSWLPGHTLFDELRTHPWRAWQLGVLFGRVQAAIHALPAPDIMRMPDDSTASWIQWCGPGEELLQERLRSIPHRSDALLHLDYHPLNVLTDGKRMTGILDWMNTRAGDPRADAARTVAILRVDSGGRRLHLPEIIVRRVFEWGWRRGYEQIGPPLGDLSLFYAWAGAVMERDLAHKRSPQALVRIHRWTTYWKKRAGL